MHKPKVPTNLVLVAQLSSGITGVVSITYIILSILGLIYRFNCNEGIEGISGARYFWNTIYRIYIQDLSCYDEQVAAASAVSSLTRSYTVFIFLTLTLSFSVVTLITSIVLMSLINNNEAKQYINIYVYTYIISWVGSLIVDITFASHLGMDYVYLGNQLGDAVDPNDFLLILIRQGAFYLMTISLKGYAIHAFNLVLILMMIVFLYDYQDVYKQDEHSIHKIGTINAFDQPRRQDDNWVNPDMYAGPSFSRGQINSGFADEEPRNPNRNDYFNSRAPSSYRSNSWNHQPGVPQSAPQPTPTNSSSRPFSYLEDVRRPVPVKSPVSPASNDNWRGAWPAPSVPAPDYSPHSQRRLKSALKPNYM